MPNGGTVGFADQEEGFVLIDESNNLADFVDEDDHERQDDVPPQSCKDFIAAILDPHLDQSQETLRPSIVVQNFLLGVILFSTACTVVETVPDIEEAHSVAFPTLELCFTMIFTLEIIMRLWVAGSCCEYLSSVWSVVDLLATLPWYAEMLLARGETMHWNGLTGQTPVTDEDEVQMEQVEQFWTLRMIRTIRMVRLLRVIRLMKTGRHFEDVSAVFGGIHASRRQLVILILLTMYATLFAATAIFHVECEERDTKFTSIPASMWWALPTVTGVGYGDLVPLTVDGKIIAATTMVAGVLITSVSGALITSSFIEEYQEAVREKKRKNEQKQRKTIKGRKTSKERISSNNVAGEVGEIDDGDDEVQQFEDKFKQVKVGTLSLVQEMESWSKRHPVQNCTHRAQMKFLREQIEVWFKQLQHMSENHPKFGHSASMEYMSENHPKFGHSASMESIASIASMATDTTGH